MTNSAQTERIHKALRHICNRTPVLGVRQHRHAFWKIHPGLRRHDHGREVGRCGAGASFHGLLSQRGDARPLGFPRGPQEHAGGDGLGGRRWGFASARSTPMFSRTRFTRMDRWAIPTRKFARPRSITFWKASRSASRRAAGTSRSGSPTVRAIRGPLPFAIGSNGLPRACETAHAHLSPKQRLLVEYKPFEPYFYHTDLGDWGMALIQSRHAGPQAKVLVDTGHHYQAQNIEQIVAWLLSEDMLGGFHFNDRRYADDDLTLGSIDPYQVFRIFNEVIGYERETGKRADIAYMIDQSHNLKDKIEEMIQTAVTAQELYCQGRAGGSREADPSPDEGRIDRRRGMPEGGFCQRCAPGHPGMAAEQGIGGGSAASLPRLRLHGASGHRAGRKNKGAVASYA